MDYDHAIEIAPRIWWVGSYLENDSFQCHSYLLEQGSKSVLFDPGSSLTFRHTLRKVEEVIPFSHIQYFVCHHQDPDITGSLPLIDELVSRDDAVILSHWRGNALLKHYGLRLPLICVEQEGWKLELEDRTLKFILTPYLHFPGALVTFDPCTGTLFSSDLFGAFTESWELFARDISHFENMRPFHEHYMPSREILLHSLLTLEKLPLKMIAPQHGSIIPEELVLPIFNRLKSLDCGLFLMAQTSTELEHLMNLNRILRNFMRQMVLTRDFSEVVLQFQESLKEMIPLNSIEFYTKLLDDSVLNYKQSRSNSMQVRELPEGLEGIFGLDMKSWTEKNERGFSLYGPELGLEDSEHGILLPLFSSETKRIFSLVLLQLTEAIEPDEETSQLLKDIQLPFGVSMEREMIYRQLEKEKQSLYEQAIRDHLTGLHTRRYMHETVSRLCSLHDRDGALGFGMAIFDLDDFKSINDTWGHIAGDEVLKFMGHLLTSGIRGGDIAVRYGGEEMVMFIVSSDPSAVEAITQRILDRVSQQDFSEILGDRVVSASAGLAMHRQGENLDALILRADQALYHSKSHGKNRLSWASSDSG